jgi:heat shock protein HtpX
MIRNLIQANKTKSWLIVFFFMVFVIIAMYIIAYAMGYGQIALPFALLVSFLGTFFSYYYSDKIVLGMSGARPATHEEDRMLDNIVEGLCLAAGLPKPKIYVIDDSAPNAFATGRNPQHAVVCVTTGLLEKLNRNELEGVVAHELSHIKNYDTLLMTVTAVMLGTLTLLSEWFLRSLWWGGGRRYGSRSDDKRRGGGGGAAVIFLVLGIVFALLAPLVAQLIHLAISRRREFLADASGALLTRYPKGLADALRKLSADTEPLEAANKATAHLYIVNPLIEHGGMINKLFSTHPPTEERIAALEKM